MKDLIARERIDNLEGKVSLTESELTRSIDTLRFDLVAVQDHLWRLNNQLVDLREYLGLRYTDRELVLKKEGEE